MDSSIQSAIIQAANNAGVDPSLAVAVAQQESGGDQSARGSSGEVGIFQLMPATAAGLGVNPYDATQNILGGVEYLAQQISAFGDLSQALAAYNWGPANVKAAVAQYGSNWLSHAPASTQSYVSSILASTSLASFLPAGLTTTEILPWALGGFGILAIVIAIS